MSRLARSNWILLGLLAAVLVGGFLLRTVSSSEANESAPSPADTTIQASLADTATFAGGCFWCMEPPYDKIEGVASTTSGFAGGEKANPSYKEVASGATKHTETVQVVYDSTKVSYERLLRVYWHNVDPFDGDGQFCDRGLQYRPAIFAHNERQQALAEESRETVAARFDQPIAVQIHQLEAFYAVRSYHQNFYKKNPTHYKRYRRGCGRDARLREIWGEAAGSDAPLTTD